MKAGWAIRIFQHVRVKLVDLRCAKAASMGWKAWLAAPRHYLPLSRTSAQPRNQFRLRQCSKIGKAANTPQFKLLLLFKAQIQRMQRKQPQRIRLGVHARKPAHYAPLRRCTVHGTGAGIVQRTIHNRHRFVLQVGAQAQQSLCGKFRSMQVHSIA